MLDLSPEEISELSEEVRALAAERDAVILAHNYQVPEVQDVADYIGDSLGLSRQAAATDAAVIAFCGVHFMAETASILSPEKTVLIPDLDAGCSLSDSIDADQLRAWKAEAPGRGRRHVRQHLGRGEGGDRLLLHLLERGQGRRAHLARARPRDRDPLRPRHVARRLRRARDGLPRPERTPASTSGTASATSTPGSGPTTSRRSAGAPRGRVPDPPRVRLLDPGDGVRRRRRHRRRGRPHALDLGDARHVEEHPDGEFIVATENGMLYPLQQAAPRANLIEANRMAFCKYMKMITLPKLRDSLREMKFEVSVPAEIAERARVPIERMVAIG